MEEMKNLRIKLSYALYTLLVAFLFTSCESNDYMVVTDISTDKTKKYNFYIKTTEFCFRTDKKLMVGDTLYISKNNCN